MSDKQKMLNKLASNYLKMLNEETCEIIRIKFWGGLEEQIKNLNYDSDIVVKMLIEEILSKNLEILTSKNLLFSITSFLSGKSNRSFCEGFYPILTKFMDNYEENQYFYENYLADLSVNILKKNLELGEEIIKELDFFIYMIEIDYELFSSALQNNFILNESTSDSKNLPSYFKNKIFFQIFTNFIVKLIKVKNVESLLFYLEWLDNCKKNSENMEAFINLYKHVLGSFNDILKLNDEASHNRVLSLSMKILKNIQNIIKNIKEQNIINSLQLSEFYTILDQFILSITEIIHSNKKFPFSYLEIFFNFYKLEIPQFQSSQNYIISLLLSNRYEIFDVPSLLIFLKFLNKFRAKITSDNFTLIMTQIILNSLNSTNKLKYLNMNSETPKELKFKTIIKNAKNFTSSDSDNTIGSFYNISNFKLIFYIVESCFDLKMNEDNSELIEITLYEENIIATFKTLLSINLESFDLNFQNFLFKFLFECLFVFYLTPIKSQTEKFVLSGEIFDLFFKNLKKISDKSFLKNEIYPIVINTLQTIFLPNYLSFTQNKTNIEEISELKILDCFFEFLFDLSRDDTIANLTSKLIISLYNLKLNEVYTNKIYALNKFVQLVVSTNSSKFFVIYFNFIMDNLKLSAADNSYTMYLLYDSLNNYSRNYEGALQSILFDYVFSKFEKNMEGSPDEFNFETLFSFNVIYNILVKDQPENLVAKFYEYFHNTKFLKIFDKIFKIFANAPYKIDEEKFWELLSNLDGSIKTENINKNLQDFTLTNLILKKKLDSNYILVGILLVLSKIFSLFVSNIITYNKNSFDMKNLSDQNNKTISSLIKTFDYITNGILLSKENTITFTPHLLFLNEMFSHTDNLIFFYDVHSSFTAINILEQSNLDYSFLNEVNTKIVTDKNKRILDYLMSGVNYVYLMKNLLSNLISYETNIINLLDSKKENNHESSQMSSFVIENLYDDRNILNLVKENALLNDNKRLNSFFSKMLLSILNKQFDNTEKERSNGSYNKVTQSIYHFLLMHNIFFKYFKNLQHLINLDLVILNFYSILKLSNSQDTLRHFLHFVSFYMKSDKNVFLFAMRICLNKNILKKVLIEQTSQNISVDLMIIIEYLIIQLIFYNSYKNESLNYITSILRNIQSTCTMFDNNQVKRINYHNLRVFGGFLTKIYSILKSHSFDGKITINKKFKENLTQSLNEELLIKYLEESFINSLDLNQNFNNVKNNLNEFMLNLDNILALKELKTLFDNNLVKENIEKSCLSQNKLFQNVLLFDEFSFPMQLNTFLANYFNLKKSQEEINNKYLYILDNYLLYNVSLKNNQAKLIFDITRTLLFNKTFSDVKEFSITNWQEKFRFISMLIFNLLNDSSIKQTLYNSKSENYKAIGSIMHVNLIKKLNIANPIFMNVNLEAMDMASDDYKRYYSWIKNLINK